MSPSAPAALQGWWKFDEASGTAAADTSGLTPANGTLVGGSTFQPVAGKFGGAVYLNGTSGYVEVADNPRFEFPAAQSYTLACWFKSDGDETIAEYQTNNGLISKGYARVAPYDSLGYYQLQFNYTAGNTNSFLQFDSRQSTAAATAFRFPTAYPAGSGDVVNNAWHHCVAVIDRGAATPQLRLYLDNVLYTTANFSAAAGGGQWPMGVNPSTLIFGNHNDRYTKGWMDDIGIWDNVLTVSQISTIYANGISGIASNDTDNDGLSDIWETAQFGNLAQTATGDPDSDGATNLAEFTAGTNPTVADTDGDGLTDGAELNTYTTNPLVADTDGDSLSDGAEVLTHFTNPKLRDSDGDNWDDNVELAQGTNPLNATSRPVPPLYDLMINEFLTENLGRPSDPTAPVDIDGDSSDWVEIRNTGATVANLLDYTLSDDPALPAKYRFPSLTIPAGGYLVVFASGKARSVNGVQAHTGFKLSNTGQIVLGRSLAGGGTEVINQIGTIATPYPPQRMRSSYGRSDNTLAGTLGYFPAPTPGAANSAAAQVQEFVKDTTFTSDRGLYTGPISVTVTTATPGATLAYTLNGSEPTPTNGTQVPAIDALTPPTLTLNLSTTTLLRARAWKAGLGSSNVDTQSYLFPVEVLTQNAPIPSMGVAPADTLAWGTGGGTPANIASFPGLTFFGVNPGIVSDPVMDNRFVQSDLMVIPTISLVADWKHLFGPNSAGQTDGGIYPPAAGVPAEGADRVASLEMINPDGSPAMPNAKKGFQSDGNIHIFGGTSQGRWKSYKLSIRFQCTNDVNYRVYGDRGTNVFRNFVLDATMNMTWMHPSDANQRERCSFVRDFVMADLQNNMGQRGFHTRPVHLYLNGLYWGLYFLHEKPDHHFASAYLGGDSDNYDVFKHSTHPAFAESDPHVNTLPSNLALPVAKPTASVPAGNSTCVDNFEALLDALGTGNIGANPAVVPDLTVSANYAAVAALIDIDAFIDYMLLGFVAGNQDWADKNLYASRKRAPGGKWRFFMWDAEHTFRTGTENFMVTGGNETVPFRNGNPKQIHTRLRTSPEYRLRFADHIRQHMFGSGALTVTGMTSAFETRHTEIADAIRGESARWGHIRASLRTAANLNVPFKRSDFMTERARLTADEDAAGPGTNSLLRNRWNLYMAPSTGQFRQIATGPLYPATEAPDLSQFGGEVPAHYALVVTNPTAGAVGTVYYTLDGTDPRLSGGGVAPGALTIASGGVLDLAASTTFTGRVLNGADWSAATQSYFSVATVPASSANLVISEFSYNPANASAAEIAAGFENSNDFEFIELLNTSATAVNLLGLTFTSGVSYDFTEASTIRQLAPGGRCVIVENAAAFAFRYGAGLPIAGEFTLSTGLSNGGETLTLSTSPGAVVQSFRYNDKAPWPTAADGDGYSLVLIAPFTQPDHSLPENWRTSATALGGTPGAPEAAGYAAWKSTYSIAADQADPDGDGFTNAVEYLFGTDPNAATGPLALSAQIAPQTNAGITTQHLTGVFTYPANRTDITVRAEFATNLADWANTLATARRVSYVNNPNGTVTETWSCPTPITQDVRRFIRLFVTVP
jgi:CotH kinase protein/Concanavalin A-like lectin/glucanases superfamily/Lamin Tail Domain/Chitobiase/beta-hexosaminidase C-terminal domain/Bacterial TSP3 repeat